MKDYEALSKKHFDHQAAEYDARDTVYYSREGKISCRDIAAILKDTAYADLLDVGCGTGEMLGRLMHSYPNAKVYGMERESAIADMAATKAPVFKGDIEKDYRPYEE